MLGDRLNLKRKATFGIIGILSLITSGVLISFPYYYWLGREAYIPKSNPDLGFVLPKTPAAWGYFISGIFFLIVSIFTLLALRRTEPRIKYII